MRLAFGRMHLFRKEPFWSIVDLVVIACGWLSAASLSTNLTVVRMLRLVKSFRSQRLAKFCTRFVVIVVELSASVAVNLVAPLIISVIVTYTFALVILQTEVEVVVATCRVAMR